MVRKSLLVIVFMVPSSIYGSDKSTDKVVKKSEVKAVSVKKDKAIVVKAVKKFYPQEIPFGSQQGILPEYDAPYQDDSFNFDNSFGSCGGTK